ncbi:hypothetical protein LINPERHAP2_LOCUS25811 [Linum perenne]
MDKPMPLYRASSSNRSSPIAITGPLFSLRFDVESYISAKSELPFPIENVEVLGNESLFQEQLIHMHDYHAYQFHVSLDFLNSEIPKTPNLMLGSDLSMLEEKVKGKGLITRVNSS